jgi:(S)-2-hydroxyglutarate dehydrogenase
MPSTDILIVGAGIVGLATAYTLTQQYPDKRIAVLEKEAGLAQHQTGHNSGVLHSGVYYKPGSLKAINSLAGRRAMLEFCDREGVPYKLSGKVIVAVGEGDEARLDMLHERGVANGIAVEVIGRDRLDELEPHAAGNRALYLPNAGIVDFRLVCERLAHRVRERGHNIQTGAEVIGLTERDDSVVVRSTAGDFIAAYVVNCAGLHSDRVAALGGTPPAARIVPFRGEYYRLKPEAEHLCNALIYPVPDPQFPFLGVHFTRTAWGEVECGPNAVLAFAREGYRKTDVNVGDLWGTLTYPGFIKLGAHYWRMGAGEMWRSISKAAFVKALQRLMPEITADQLEPMPAGIRAQAVAADGRMLDDFAFAESTRMVHVVNAPSPAATASLSIGKTIVDKLAQRF